MFKGCKYGNKIPTILPKQLLGGNAVKKTYVEVEDMMLSIMVAEFGTLLRTQEKDLIFLHFLRC